MASNEEIDHFLDLTNKEKNLNLDVLLNICIMNDVEFEVCEEVLRTGLLIVQNLPAMNASRLFKRKVEDHKKNQIQLGSKRRSAESVPSGSVKKKIAALSASDKEADDANTSEGVDDADGTGHDDSVDNTTNDAENAEADENEDDEMQALQSAMTVPDAIFRRNMRQMFMMAANTDLHNKSMRENVKHINPFVVTASETTIDVPGMLLLHMEKFEDWWSTDRANMSKAVMMGKAFGSVIKASRKEGSNYIAFEKFKINISEEADLISMNDFTKTRFMACLHLFMHKKWTMQKTDSGFNVSPLVMKVVFDSNNCLTPYKYALISIL